MGCIQMGSNLSKYEHLKTTQSPLNEAQSLKFTRIGLPINPTVTDQILNRRALEKMKRAPGLAQDVRMILNPPFSDVDRITDHLYLTGVAGLLEENIQSLNITCIINATYEMPLLKIQGVESYRVPVDDDPNEEIIIYFDDVSNLINSVSKKNGRTILHCMAGASRSSTLVLAYLIKYQQFNLKKAFCFLKSIRSCARPNIGFFSQLVVYEKYLRKETSVEIIEIARNGVRIQVPDFYPRLFPDLFQAEIQKQMTKSQLSNFKLSPSNKTYLNRGRHYLEMERDIQKVSKISKK